MDESVKIFTKRIKNLNLLDKDKIHEFMTMRFNALNDQTLRDFSSGVQSRIFELREVKYWKEAIERGEFDYDGELEVYIIHDTYGISGFTFYTDKEKVKQRVDKLNELAGKEEYWYVTLFSNLRNVRDDIKV